MYSAYQVCEDSHHTLCRYTHTDPHSLNPVVFAIKVKYMATRYDVVMLVVLVTFSLNGIITRPLVVVAASRSGG